LLLFLVFVAAFAGRFHALDATTPQKSFTKMKKILEIIFNFVAINQNNSDLTSQNQKEL
jgi:hypothetical protein